MRRQEHGSMKQSRARHIRDKLFFPKNLFDSPDITIRRYFSGIPTAFFVGVRFDRSNDSYVSRTAAKMHVEHPINLFARRFRVLLDERRRMQRNRWDAIAALTTSGCPRKSSRQLITFLGRQTRNRRDDCTFRLFNGKRTGDAWISIDDSEARPALPLRTTTVLDRRHATSFP
jgi:hypothetical protein